MPNCHDASSSVSDKWPKLLAFQTATMWTLYQWLNRRGQRDVNAVGP